MGNSRADERGMSMLIRSQDKRAITDDMKLYVRENDFVHGKVTWEIRNAEQDLLATYSTEEKAIKVLDMIQDDYLFCERCKVRGEEAGSIPPFVFQMPQDSEV